MRFEKPIPKGNWDKEAFYKFCKDFDINGMDHYENPEIYVRNSAKCFSRMLSTTGRFIVRHDELYNDREDCTENYCSPWLLFDHTWIFKTNSGFRIMVSCPYSTWDLSAAEYFRLQRSMPITRGVDMFIVDNKYKFIPNGDFMLVFVAWVFHRKCLKDVLLTGVGGGRIITNGTVVRSKYATAYDAWQKTYKKNFGYEPRRSDYLNNEPIVLFKSTDTNLPWSVQYKGNGTYFKTEEEANNYFEEKMGEQTL